ncbi:MAG TPA: hypothetical protein VLB44_12775 [Kofleriaceae bacterium]|nr:hypothetical protein [Kofleriaceae bacterium]
MSQDELYAVTARVVDEFTSAAMLFTALDVSNAVKQTLSDARHRDISPIVRDLFERKGMGAYTQTQIDVMAAGNKPAKALLYHLPEQAPALYDDAMRSQLATPPQRTQRAAEDPSLGASATEAGVRIGKDGRGRVPRVLIENAGIRGDQVLVRSDTATPKLTIVAPGSAAASAPVDPLYALPDLFFAPVDGGQPLNYEHPSLLHIPRSMLDMFGQDPNLVARIDSGSVVIVKR